MIEGADSKGSRDGSAAASTERTNSLQKEMKNNQPRARSSIGLIQ